MTTIEWNVVLTTSSGHYQQASDLLQPYGEVSKTAYFNVLALQVEDVARFLEQLHQDLEGDHALAESLGRVVPVTVRFRFQTPAEFEAKAREAVEPWLTRLAGARFHVRMHRRGFKGRLSSQDEEQFLDHHILERIGLESPAVIDFDDPDYIIAVETLGQDAGLSIWDRVARDRYPLLKLD